ncbi:hypothetical protein HY732_03455 [Candidatus Uhrbacteria bacterium]|nr:hypothetical protein [Candidatus Uhrbacteria bacterium]
MAFGVDRKNYDDILPVAEVIDFTHVPWEKVRGDVLAIAKDAFLSPDMVSELDLHAWYMNPDSVTVLLKDAQSDQILGYTTAIPVRDWYREDPRMRKRQIYPETAYIPMTFIARAYQHRGLIEPLMSTMEQALIDRGYRFIERDARVVGGYADAIGRHYGDRIVSSEVRKTNVGPLAHFRIMLGD